MILHIYHGTETAQMDDKVDQVTVAVQGFLTCESHVESVYRFIFLWARFGESVVCMFIEMPKAYMHVMYVSDMTAGKFMDLKFSI